MDTNTAQNPTTESSRSTIDIIDEMADRERRKQSIVVYNFTECADLKADTEAFKVLCTDVFKLDTNICIAIRLGPKNPNKHRPLLLILEDIEDKIYRTAGFYREELIIA